MDIVVNFDGGGTSEGGPGAWGVVACWHDTVLEQYAGWSPDMTNNEAEYHGLIAALRTASKYAPQHVTVRGDSQLVIRQTLGEWKCRKAHLKPLCTEAQLLLAGLRRGSTVVLEWIPREQNTDADALSTTALHRGGSVPA